MDDVTVGTIGELEMMMIVMPVMCRGKDIYEFAGSPNGRLFGNGLQDGSYHTLSLRRTSATAFVYVFFAYSIRCASFSRSLHFAARFTEKVPKTYAC